MSLMFKILMTQLLLIGTTFIFTITINNQRLEQLITLQAVAIVGTILFNIWVYA